MFEWAMNTPPKLLKTGYKKHAAKTVNTNDEIGIRCNCH